MLAFLLVRRNFYSYSAFDKTLKIVAYRVDLELLYSSRSRVLVEAASRLLCHIVLLVERTSYLCSSESKNPKDHFDNVQTFRSHMDLFPYKKHSARNENAGPQANNKHAEIRAANQV